MSLESCQQPTHSVQVLILIKEGMNFSLSLELHYLMVSAMHPIINPLAVYHCLGTAGSPFILRGFQTCLTKGNSLPANLWIEIIRYTLLQNMVIRSEVVSINEQTFSCWMKYHIQNH